MAEIVSLSLTREDGSPMSRVEAEKAIRDCMKTVHKWRLLCSNPYGLDKRYAFNMKPTSIIHWLLDEMIRRRQVVGEEIGVKPELESDDSYFTAFQQKLAAFVQINQAIMPNEGEGIDMSDMNNGMPPAQNGYPQQPQQQFAPPPPPPPFQQGFAPPPPPPGAFQQPQGYPAPGAQPQQQYAPPPPQQQFAPPAPQGFGGPPPQQSFAPPPPPAPGAAMAPPQMPPMPPAPQAAQGAPAAGRRRAAKPEGQAAPPPPAGPPQQQFAPPAQQSFAPPQGGFQQAPPQFGGAPAPSFGHQPAAQQPQAQPSGPSPEIQALQAQVSALTKSVEAALSYAKKADQALSILLRPYYQKEMPTRPEQLTTDATFAEIGLPIPQ